MAVAIPLRGGTRPVDQGALAAALYKQHAGELLRFAWHRLGRLEDAEDAVQATFLSAHRVLQEGERVREPRAWLFRILRNECLTRIAMTKRRGTQEELGEWHADPRSSVADQMEAHDEFDIAVALLASLPEQQREAMVLREWLGMSAVETADVLDVTPQGVDALVYRARKALVGLDDVEAETACGAVRNALANGKANAKLRAHLLTCRGCRQAARQLRAPEELAVANGLLPFDVIAGRLGESIPGFATAAAVGGGAAAVGIVGTLAVGSTAKVVATVAVGAVLATGAVKGVPAVENVISPARNVVALPSAPKQQNQPPASADGTKRIVAAEAQGKPQQVAIVAAVDAGVAGAPPAAAVDGRPDRGTPVGNAAVVSPVAPVAGAPAAAAPGIGAQPPTTDPPQSGGAGNGAGSGPSTKPAGGSGSGSNPAGGGGAGSGSSSKPAESHAGPKPATGGASGPTSGKATTTAPPHESDDANQPAKATTPVVTAPKRDETRQPGTKGEGRQSESNSSGGNGSGGSNESKPASSSSLAPAKQSDAKPSEAGTAAAPVGAGSVPALIVVPGVAPVVQPPAIQKPAEPGKPESKDTKGNKDK